MNNENSEQELLKINKDLSTLLDTFSPNMTDEEMNKMMTKVLETLGHAGRADRCFVWENYYMPDSDILCMKQIYEWVNEEYAYPVQDTELIEIIPYAPDLYDILSAGNTLNVIVKDLDDYNREILEAQHIKSILCVPIHIEGNFWGFIGFDNCRSEELWSSFEEKILITASLTIGQIIKKYRGNV